MKSDKYDKLQFPNLLWARAVFMSEYLWRIHCRADTVLDLGLCWRIHIRKIHRNCICSIILLHYSLIHKICILRTLGWCRKYLWRLFAEPAFVRICAKVLVLVTTQARFADKYVEMCDFHYCGRAVCTCLQNNAIWKCSENDQLLLYNLVFAKT